MKKYIIVLLLVFGSLQLLSAQFKVTLPKKDEVYFRYKFYNNDELTLVYCEKFGMSNGKDILKWISVNLKTDAQESGDVFNDEFYKDHKAYSRFEQNYQVDEFIINIGDAEYFANANEKKLVVAYDLVKKEIFEFEVEAEKGKSSSVMQIVKNGNNLIFFVKKEQASYWTGNKLETNYYLYTLDLTDKTVNENTFTLKDKDFYISEVLAYAGGTSLLIKYRAVGTGYALLNYQNLELTGISFESSFQYTFGGSAQKVKGGLIYSNSMGTDERAKEEVYVGINGEDNSFKQLPTLPIDPNYYIAYVDNKTNLRIDGSIYYISFGKDKSIAITVLSLDDVQRTIIPSTEKISLGPMLEISEDKLVWLSLNTSEVGLKKCMVTLDLKASSAQITPLDKKFTFDYKSVEYEDAGTTKMIYYKQNGSELTLEKKVEVN